MTVQELGSIGELIAAVATLATLIYLAIQIRQNTAQQKREELISVQHGQNALLTQFQDPRIFGGYARTADDKSPTVEDRASAITFVVQYINHFHVVH